MYVVYSNLGVCQVSENFSDGNYTQNPIWVGDVGKFVIGGDSLRSNSITVNDTFYLSTASSQATQAQWEFYTRVGVSTSSVNFVDIFLMSDVSNLKQTQNGYFVRIGGTSDEISLYKIANGNTTMIIDGANASVSSSNNKVKVKVTRDINNLWILKREVNGTGNSFVTEQTVTDFSVISSNFFGFLVRQSVASNFKKHWLDDINVGPIILDTTPPLINSTTVVSNNQLDVLFNEDIDATSAQNVLNYTVNNTIGNPVNAQVDANNFSLVHLTFANGLMNGLENTLTINNVTDISNNVINSNTTINFYVAKLFDVVINEIMADPTPTVGLPDAEYIELYNKSSNTINLNNFTLTIGNSIKTLPAYNLASGAYVLLVNPISSAAYNTLPNLISLTGLSTSSLTNTGTSLVLKNNFGDILHQISYTDQWYLDALKANGGWSIEQIDPNNPCGTNTNWRASENINGGTPGIVNSIYGINTDNISPGILSTSIINDSTIQVQFSEIVLTSVLNNPLGYFVNNGIGNPTSILISGALGNNVKLVFSNPFAINTIYIISITGLLFDCAGNPQGGVLNSNFSRYNPSTFDIVFNEIMADPDPPQNLPNVEYVEIYNRTNFPINLTNWKFKYGTTEKTIESGFIAANGYAIITSPQNALALASVGNYNIVNIPDLANSFLTNTGTNLLLQDSSGHDICFTNYSDTWYGSTDKALGGWSLEKIDPNNLCAEKTNWIAATTLWGGTPGGLNSVNDSNPDNLAPKIKNICVLDSNTIQLNFSELVSTLSFTNSNISFNNNLTLSQIFVGNEFSNSIIIKTIQNFSTNIIYTVTISSTISDCNGNLSTSNSSINFSNNIANLYELVINEIMADPTPVINNLPELEYVEILNKGSFPISLNDYSYVSGTTINTIGCITINPNEYALICNIDEEASFVNYGKTIGVNSVSISNTGEILKILNPQNEIISIVNFSDSWYGSTYKANGGWSLEQIDPNNPCGGLGNWKASASANGGTPGILNSVNESNPDIIKPELIRALIVDNNKLRLFFTETLSGTSILDTNLYQVDNAIGKPYSAIIAGVNASDIILTFNKQFVLKTTYQINVNTTISDCVGNNLTSNSSSEFAIAEDAIANDVLVNEILYNPQTDGYDYVEIYNNSLKVIDLKHLRISNIDSTNLSLSSISEIDSIGYLIFPGKYYVITENKEDIIARYNVENKKNFIVVDNMPTLSITEGSFAISKANLELIDYAFYNDEMQFPLLKSTKGVSLERISFNLPSRVIGNWHSASQTVGFGTPTYQNSQFNVTKNSDDFITLSKEIFSPDNDGYEDVLLITLKSQTQGNVCNINIYNQRGVLIKELANNLLLGTTNDVISWDGTNTNNEKSEIGIYLIIVSTFETNGNTNQYKKQVVVAGKL